MNKVIIVLKDFATNLSNVAKQNVSLSKLYKLEDIYVANRLQKEVIERVNYLQQWEDNIGKWVYCSTRGFNYCTVEDFENLDHLNQSYFDRTKQIHFTEQLFDELVESYINYQLSRLMKDLQYADMSHLSVTIRGVEAVWQHTCIKRQIELYEKIKELFC
jgi:hypothetical protein